MRATTLTFKQYKQLEEYYVEVELHLFKSKRTFLEVLEYAVNDEEMLNEYNIERDVLIEFIDAIVCDVKYDEYVKKNTLVSHTHGGGFEVLHYNLKQNQSFSAFDKTVNKYMMQNSKGMVANNCTRVILGGTLEINDGIRTYLFINN